MKRTAAVVLAGVLCALTLCGCKTSGNPLPEGMEEEIVLTQGREVVALLNDGDYGAVYDQMRDDAQQASSQEDVQRYMETVLEEAGAYEKESEAMATGQTLDSTGEEYGTAVFYCQHEKKDVLYRIAYDQSMELMGLEIKIG